MIGLTANMKASVVKDIVGFVTSQMPHMDHNTKLNVWDYAERTTNRMGMELMDQYMRNSEYKNNVRKLALTGAKDAYHTSHNVQIPGVANRAVVNFGVIGGVQHNARYGKYGTANGLEERFPTWGQPAMQKMQKSGVGGGASVLKTPFSVFG